MPRFATLLRGVNVGRGNRVPMSEFRALLEELGYRKVRTVLNSGNAVFTARAGAARVHADRIRDELNARLGVFGKQARAATTRNWATVVKIGALLRMPNRPVRHPG